MVVDQARQPSTVTVGAGRQQMRLAWPADANKTGRESVMDILAMDRGASRRDVLG